MICEHFIRISLFPAHAGVIRSVSHRGYASKAVPRTDLSLF